MDIFKAINWVDVLVVILLIRTCYVGANVGFTIELQRITGLIAGFVISYYFYKQLGQFIAGNSFISINLAEIFSLIIVLIACLIVIKLLTVLLSKVLKFQFKPQFEKIAGGIIGALRGIFLSSVVLVVLGMLPSNYVQDSITGRSLSGGYIIKVAIGSYNLLAKFFSLG